MDKPILTSSGIYKILNKGNGKAYVGSAVNLRNRCKQHCRHLASGAHHSIKLQRAWDKYGEYSFTFIVLELVPDKTVLIKREQFWIDRLMAFGDAGYNCAPSAGSNLGIKRNQKTLDKMRASGLKYVASPETIEKLRVASTGKKASPEKLEKMRALVKSPETIEKLRLAGIGRKLSEESIKKMRDFNTGIKKSDAAKEKMRAAKLGKKQSPELIEKRMAKIRGRKQSPEEIAKRVASRLANQAAKNVI